MMKSKLPEPDTVKSTRQYASVIAPAADFISAPTAVKVLCVILVVGLEKPEALSDFTVQTRLPEAAKT